MGVTRMQGKIVWADYYLFIHFDVLKNVKINYIISFYNYMGYIMIHKIKKSNSILFKIYFIFSLFDYCEWCLYFSCALNSLIRKCEMNFKKFILLFRYLLSKNMSK